MELIFSASSGASSLSWMADLDSKTLEHLRVCFHGHPLIHGRDLLFLKYVIDPLSNGRKCLCMPEFSASTADGSDFLHMFSLHAGNSLIEPNEKVLSSPSSKVFIHDIIAYMRRIRLDYSIPLFISEALKEIADHAYVETLYYLIMQRPSDPEGLAASLRVISDHDGRLSLAKQMLDSQEYHALSPCRHLSLNLPRQLRAIRDSIYAR